MLKLTATAAIAFVLGAYVMFEAPPSEVGDHWNVTMTSETMEGGEVVDFYNMYRCEGVSTEGDCIQIVCYMHGDKPVGVHRTLWATSGETDNIQHRAPYAAVLSTTSEGNQHGYFMSNPFEFEMLTDKIMNGTSISIGTLHFQSGGSTFKSALTTMRRVCGLQ